MASNTSLNASAKMPRSGWGLLLCVLVVVLVGLFFPSFTPGMTLFSNDAPLGAAMAPANLLPGNFTGIWQDLNWLGAHGGSAVPSVTFLLLAAMGPVAFSKFYGPMTLLFFGISVYAFCRQLRFQPMTCLLTALAATLNMDIFSNVCWGLGTRATTIGSTFLALAAIVSGMRRQAWLKFPLAGLCVGMAVTEGADVGVIFSLCVAAFTVVAAVSAEGPVGKSIIQGTIRTAVIAGFAGLMAFGAISALLHAGVVSAVESQQKTRSWEENWDFATQWSLPKVEALRVIVPGLFGYRTDPGEPGQYWGTVGRQPGWEQHHQGFPRHSGSGEYAGVVVALVALWALGASFSRKGQSFSDTERRLIWFWTIVAVLSMLFAFGRHAPFYRLIYPLPFFKAVRNPIKFMHPFHLSLLILFGYGLHGLSRRYLETTGAKARSLAEQWKSWWAKATPFERNWTRGSCAGVIMSGLAWLIYTGGSNALEGYLTSAGFEASQAAVIARFSLHEAGLFVFFFILSVGLVTLIMSGALAGPRAKWAGILIGLLLIVDLSRADAPWIKHYNYQEKLAPNPILDVLRQKSHEHRVVASLVPRGQAYLVNNQGQIFAAIYNEWLQNQFPAYGIQSLDITQMPRVPQLDEAMFEAFRPMNFTNDLRKVGRLWQLTNTRYVLGMSGFLDLLNQWVDPIQKGFRIHTQFDIVPKLGVTQVKAVEDLTLKKNEQGAVALFENVNVLPRVALFSHWQAATNDQAAVEELAKPSFDPTQRVLVSGGAALPEPSHAPSTNGTTAVITSYAPKTVRVRTRADVPAVLLLNDRFDPDWHVRVDGQPVPLLRCNFIMRGVFLTPGNHAVEFYFAPPLTGLYTTSAALAIGLFMSGCLVVTSRARGPGPEK